MFLETFNPQFDHESGEKEDNTDDSQGTNSNRHLDRLINRTRSSTSSYTLDDTYDKIVDIESDLFSKSSLPSETNLNASLGIQINSLDDKHEYQKYVTARNLRLNPGVSSNTLAEIPVYRWRPGQVTNDDNTKEYKSNRSFDHDTDMKSYHKVKSLVSQSSKSSTPAILDFSRSSHAGEDGDIHFEDGLEPPIASMAKPSNTTKSKKMAIPYWRTLTSKRLKFPHRRNKVPSSFLDGSQYSNDDDDESPNSNMIQPTHSNSPRSITGTAKKLQSTWMGLLPPWMSCRLYILFVVVICAFAIGTALYLQYQQHGTLLVKKPTNIFIDSDNSSDLDIDIDIDIELDVETTLTDNPEDTAESPEDVKEIDIIDYPYKWDLSGTPLLGPLPNAHFGYSTSISSDGTILAVGIPMIQTPDSEFSPPTGMVQIYQFKSNGAWERLGNRLFGQIPGDQFGQSISLSPDGYTIAIGAKWYFSDSNESFQNNQGNVQLFQYQATKDRWEQIGEDIRGGMNGDQFGYSLSTSNFGMRVAVGSPSHSTFTSLNKKSIPNIGLVSVLEYTQNQWNPIGDNLKGQKEQLYFGQSISMSSNGNVLAIGSSGDLDQNRISPTFLRDSNSNDIVSETRMKESSISARYHGGVTVYQYDTDLAKWEQMGEFLEGESMGDEAGYSVSVSENGMRVAMGAMQNDGSDDTRAQPQESNRDDNRGHVRVYQYHYNADLNGTLKGTWIQLGMDIDGNNPGDYFGASIELSGNGNRIAIGATQHDSKKNAGYIRIYEYSELDFSWIPIAKKIEGVSNGDFAGFSIAITAEGDRIAVGSPLNDENGKDSGHVRVFDLSRNL